MRTGARAVEGGGHWLRSWSGIGAMFLILAAALLLAGCGEDQSEQTTPEEEGESAGPNVAVSISDITDNPSEYYGTRVTVSGLVTDELDANSFSIGGDDFFGDQALPVVSAEPLDQVVQDSEVLDESDGDLVQVTGTIRDFNDIDDGEIVSDLGSDVFSAFEGQAALVADSAVVTPAGAQQGGGAQPGETLQLSLSEITDNPLEFYGETVTVSGPIARIVEPNTFVMASDQAMDQNDQNVDLDFLIEQGVLVAGGDDLDVSEGQNVQVTGQIQQFDIDQFEEEVGVAFNQNNDTYSAFSGAPVSGDELAGDEATSEGRPAIIADSVEATN